MENIQRCDKCGNLTDKWFQTGVKKFGSMEVGTWCSTKCYKKAGEPVFESKKLTKYSIKKKV